MSVDGAALLALLGVNPSSRQTDPVLRALIAQVSGLPAGASEFNEAVEDLIGTKLVAGALIVVSYNDATGETTISSTASSGPAIVTPSITTAVIADGATETGTLAIASVVTTAMLQEVTGSDLCWLRLYESAAARTADAARLIATDPIAGTGLLSQVAPGIDSAGLTVPITPAHELHNADGPRTGTLYYALTNLSGGAAAITVDLVVVALDT